MAGGGLGPTSVEGIVPTEEELAAIKRKLADSFIYASDGKRRVAVVTRANTDTAELERNVAINIARPLPRLMNRVDLMRCRNEPIAIVAGGPSVKHQLDEIRQFKWVMTAGNAHDFMTDNGILPDFAVAVDAKEDTPLYFRNPAGNCTYLLASIAQPRLFDQLKNQNVQLWHFYGQVDPIHYRGEKSIGWGCMVSIASIYLALWLGFQEQHYFGYDCCFERETHAYPVLDEERQGILETMIDASIGEAGFKTTPALIACLDNFYEVYKGDWGKYLKGYVHGRGMLWENIRQSPPEMKQWLEAV